MNWQDYEGICGRSKASSISPFLKAVRRDDVGGNLEKWQPYYKIIRQIALEEKTPGVILELGVWHGMTAAFVCDYGEFHKHLFIGVDINRPDFSNPGFTFLKGDTTSPEVYRDLKALADLNGGIFLVYQDSSHHYLPTKKEWEFYSPLVRPGGIWIADDCTDAFKREEDQKSMLGYFQEISYPGMDENNKRLFDEQHIGSRQGVVLF